MTFESHPQRRLFLVGVPLPVCDALAAELTGWELCAFPTVADAESCAEPAPHVVLVPAEDITLDWIAHWPQARSAKSAVLTSYEDLPRLFQRHFVKPVADRLIPNHASMEAIAQSLRSLAEGRSADPRPADRDVALSNHMRLERTALRLATLEGVVVRPVKPATPLELHFVVEMGEPLERFRRLCVTDWKWPVKPKNGPTGREFRKHPVVKRFGKVSPEQEIYASDDPDGSSAFIGIFPWRKGGAATVVIGYEHVSAEDAPHLRASIAETFSAATARLPEFPLPRLPRDRAVHYVPEYDWVVTRHYAGPDRRHMPTSLVNRYLFSGSRQELPELRGETQDVFVDQISRPVKALAALYILGAAIDSWLTYRYVSRGAFQELNPLLKGALEAGPWRFFLVKNVLALAALFVAVRFEKVRAGLITLAAIVLGYVLLDAYWAVLLLMHR